MTLKKEVKGGVLVVECEGFGVGRGRKNGHKWTDGRTEMKERWRRLVKDLVE